MEIPPRYYVLYRESSLQSSAELVQCCREIRDFIPLGRVVYDAHVLWE